MAFSEVSESSTYSLDEWLYSILVNINVGISNFSSWNLVDTSLTF